MRKYTRLKEDANMNRSIRPELCNSTITNAPQKTLVFSFQKLVYFCFFPALFIGKNQWCLNRIQQFTENDDEHFECHVSCGGGIYAIGPICIYLHTYIHSMWGPAVTSWFINPMNTIVISIIEHREIGGMFTNLAIINQQQKSNGIPGAPYIPAVPVRQMQAELDKTRRQLEEERQARRIRTLAARKRGREE